MGGEMVTRSSRSPGVLALSMATLFGLGAVVAAVCVLRIFFWLFGIWAIAVLLGYVVVVGAAILGWIKVTNRLR